MNGIFGENEYHVGVRPAPDLSVEAACSCRKAPCGHAILFSGDCTRHKSTTPFKRFHHVDKCPGVLDGEATR